MYRPDEALDPEQLAAWAASAWRPADRRERDGDREDPPPVVATTVEEFERTHLLTAPMRAKLRRGEPLVPEDFGD